MSILTSNLGDASSAVQKCISAVHPVSNVCCTSANMDIQWTSKPWHQMFGCSLGASSFLGTGHTKHGDLSDLATDSPRIRNFAYCRWSYRSIERKGSLFYTLPLKEHLCRLLESSEGNSRLFFFFLYRQEGVQVKANRVSCIRQHSFIRLSLCTPAWSFFATSGIQSCSKQRLKNFLALWSWHYYRVLPQ